MTAVFGRSCVVRWADLDTWVVPIRLLLTKRLPEGWKFAYVGEVAKQIKKKVRVEPEREYRMIGVRWYGRGTFYRETSKGESLSATYLTSVLPNALIYNRLFAWKGSFAVVPKEHSGHFVSSEFPQFVTDERYLLPDYLYLFFMCGSTIRAVDAFSVGSAAVSRNRLKEEIFLDFKIPLPPILIQKAIIMWWKNNREEIAEASRRVEKIENEIQSLIYTELGTPAPISLNLAPKYMALKWKDLERWSFSPLARARQGLAGFTSSRYQIESLGQHLIGTMNGYSVKPVVGPTSYKILKLSALSPAGLDLDQTKFVNVSERIADKFSLHKGDLLICRSVGSYDHIAKCALVEENEPHILFPDIIIRARFSGSILPDYAREVMQTPLGRSYFQSSARTAVGMWKIGAEDIHNFPIPLPPLERQERITQLVGEKRAEIAREQERIRCLTSSAEKEIEEMILGIRPVPEMKGQQQLSV